MTVSSQSVDNKSNEVVDWSDLGQRMWTRTGSPTRWPR